VTRREFAPPRKFIGARRNAVRSLGGERRGARRHAGPTRRSVGFTLRRIRTLHTLVRPSVGWPLVKRARTGAPSDAKSQSTACRQVRSVTTRRRDGPLAPPIGSSRPIVQPLNPAVLIAAIPSRSAQGCGRHRASNQDRRSSAACSHRVCRRYSSPCAPDLRARHARAHADHQGGFVRQILEDALPPDKRRK
jgi:hypothetical protein